MKIYHGIPEQVEGDKLMPLNQMTAVYPDLYAKYAKKYEGREQVMQQTIPLLNCLWNDVVQFLPLHPRAVFEKQQQLGLIEAVPPYKFYEFDVSALDPDQTVVFFKTAPGTENVTVKWLKDVDFEALQTIPPATINYYTSLQGTGELPFNYQFIPHILYHGTLAIDAATTLTL